jgi:hypothetical protein
MRWRQVYNMTVILHMAAVCWFVAVSLVTVGSWL